MLDMHMKHLNNIAKGAISSNKLQKAITQIGQSIGTLSPVFDKDNHIQDTLRTQKRPTTRKDIEVSCERASQSGQFHDKQYQKKAFTFTPPK